MTALIILLINLMIPLPILAQRLTIILVTIIAILSVADVSIVQQFPLKAYSMEWLPFAIGGLLIGSILSKFIGNNASQ